MSFSYDPSTVAGQVRLLADDTDETTALFTDVEIQTFLDLNAQRVRLAAAQALEARAASRAIIQRIVPEGTSTDGTSISAELRRLAQQLRALDALDPTDPGFDIAEMDLDVFSMRELLLNRALRLGA